MLILYASRTMLLTHMIPLNVISIPLRVKVEKVRAKESKLLFKERGISRAPRAWNSNQGLKVKDLKAIRVKAPP